ncbi:putativeDNA-binding protein [Patulibacter medicamentivorans]|uniref:PutativeDNA-binding protein n=1 Tax=Patulibacter medicamentivorans TaxID=1097667 RepID=H0E0K7_9ACTN|nr:hypothetical protein [Patulibacter medicamentivorans]EHN12741.1 putativeDNA-binding protein [Patulibacter medicamentivorans]
MTPLLERFRDPGRSFFPTPIWWWSGERLDPARLRWQMERLVAGGAPNLVVMNLLPTVSEMGKSRDDPALFSERWWTIFEGVCRDAEELGVSLWLYDQIGHGGANLLGEVIAEDPSATGLVLERAVVDVDGRGAVECPPAGTVVAAALVERDGTIRPVAPAGGVASAEGSGRLMLFYTVPRGLDFLSRGACDQLIRVAFEGYEQRVPQYLGNVIVGSFQDELPPIQNWSPGFPERFRQIAGYDLLPRLAELWDDLTPESGRVRRDFHHVRGKLAEDAFFVPLHDWHERHGMLSAFDQDYGARDGDPAGSSRLYGDYLRTHRWFSAPGSDHHGDAKIHSSLAHAYGRERVWIESFHSSGWGGTLEETFDWLLPWIGAGANLYDPHATYYSTHHGWWEWAPPATDWRQPYWRHHLEFARAVARLCSVLSWGTHACDVAVLFPSATAQAALTPDGQVAAAGREACEAYHRITGRMTWFDTAPGVLNELCRDFDVLDDDTVAAAEAGDGTLAHRGERYRTVILPACVAIEAATARRLVEFVDAGGDLVAVGPLPASAAGVAEDDAPVEALRQRFARGVARQVDRPEDLVDALAAAPASVRADVPTLCRRDGEQVVLFVPAVFPRASRVGKAAKDADPAFDWLVVDIDFEPSRWAREREIVVSGVEGAPQLWEPFSGRRRQLEAEPTKDGVKVRVPFDDGPAALLVWGRSEELPAAEPRFAEPVALDGRWEVQIESTLEDRWGDLDAPPAELPVEAWTLEHEDDGRSLPAHATFGARARWTGPAAPDVLPAPGEEPRDGGWRDAVWSPSRGIRKDPLHRHALGPSGRVPEEFLRFGQVERGQAVHVRTVLHAAAAAEAHLVIGGAATTSAWLDGRPVELVDAGYLAHARVALPAGPTVLDLRLVADESLDLRASFTFVADLEGSLIPDWIRTAGPARARSVVAFTGAIELDADPIGGQALVGASGPCRVLLDGHELGRHAGYKAEIEGPRDELAYYDLGDRLAAGRHELRVEVDDVGHASPAAQVDVVVETVAGQVRLHSGRDWSGERDGVAVPVEIRRAPAGLINARDGQYIQSGDLVHTHLWKRPHPLPDAVWLEPERAGADAGTSIDARIAAESPTQRFRVTAPPGARRLQVALAGGCRLLGLRVAGDPVALGPSAPGAPCLVELPDGDRGPRSVELAIEPAPGLRGGGVLAGPLRFATGVGMVELGDWQAQGLASHSGGVRYRRTLGDDVPAGRLRLDLGVVRGTAELLVDGERVGVRVCSPYRFELSAGPGSVLEVLVLNTLGPHLDAVSPTHYVFDGQTRSGLFGPVTLAAGRADREEAA